MPERALLGISHSLITIPHVQRNSTSLDVRTCFQSINHDETSTTSAKHFHHFEHKPRRHCLRLPRLDGWPHQTRCQASSSPNCDRISCSQFSGLARRELRIFPFSEAASKFLRRHAYRRLIAIVFASWTTTRPALRSACPLAPPQRNWHHSLFSTSQNNRDSAHHKL